jgi:putative endonuclease
VYHVYVLRSERDGRLYTGVTGDLKRRLGEHNRGKVRSTSRRRPLVLIYSESFESKVTAMQRERFFKTPEGGILKQRLIEESRSGTVD